MVCRVLLSLTVNIMLAPRGLKEMGVRQASEEKVTVGMRSDVFREAAWVGSGWKLRSGASGKWRLGGLLSGQHWDRVLPLLQEIKMNRRLLGFSPWRKLESVPLCPRIIPHFWGAVEHGLGHTQRCQGTPPGSLLRVSPGSAEGTIGSALSARPTP